MALPSDDPSRVIAIDEMINKYSIGLQRCAVSRSASRFTSSMPVAALLTGSTGSLGSQILVEMVLDDRFTKIYAFNRPSNQSIFERHQKTFDDRGLDTTLLTHPKIVYICGDTSQASLGLTAELYDEIRSSVTLIIHNAWTLGFIPLLASFEENIRGTRHLIDFCLSSPHPSSIRFLFTSSISSASSWKHEYGLLPEDTLLDSRVGVGLGYGESKYVAERILASSGLQSCSFRLSQIYGSAPRGSWPTSEWFPLFIKICIDLKCFPLSRGASYILFHLYASLTVSATQVVSWIPTDVAARSIVDVGLAGHVPDSALNLVHPRPIAFASLMELIGQELLERESNLRDVKYPLVPVDLWISRLVTHLRQISGPTYKKAPNAKMMKLFIQVLQAEPTVLNPNYESGGFPIASTNKMQLLSPSFRQLEQIGKSDVKRWLNYWESIGFLDWRSERSIAFAKL